MEMAVITRAENLASVESGELVDGPKGIVLAVDDLAGFEAGFVEAGGAARLARQGFTLFAVAGEKAEAAHDSLDDALEAEGFIDVVTTFHDDDTPDELAAFLATTAKANNLTQLVVICRADAGYEAEVLKHLGSQES